MVKTQHAKVLIVIHPATYIMLDTILVSPSSDKAFLECLAVPPW